MSLEHSLTTASITQLQLPTGVYSLKAQEWLSPLIRSELGEEKRNRAKAAKGYMLLLSYVPRTKVLQTHEIPRFDILSEALNILL